MVVKTDIPLVKIADYQMREERWAPAAVAQGDYLYIVGGSTGWNALHSIERFNVRTGKSEDFAKLDTGRLLHCAVLAGNKIYVLGGWNQALGVEASVEVVDAATGKVSFAAPMAKARAEFACVVLDEKIYVIGGQILHGRVRACTNTMEIFDLVTGTWSEGVPMPTPRVTSGTVVDGGLIIVPGGYDYQRSRDEVEVFNPRANAWRTIASLCRPWSAHSLVFLGHYLFLFGDYGSPDELLAYDLNSKRSETFTLQYKPARHAAAVVHEGKIYVVGGKPYRYWRAMNSIQVFAPPGKK